MFVNAHTNPGPALWQGIMFIVVAVWAWWIACGDKPRSAAEVRAAFTVVVITGVGLLIAVLALY